jgi:two-component system sensor histidine kinase PilS (NtrC family)
MPRTMAATSASEDRRRRDRRGTNPRGRDASELDAAPASWFGAFDATLAEGKTSLPWPDARASKGEGGQAPSDHRGDAAEAADGASRFGWRQVLPHARSGPTATQRIYRAFVAARAGVGLMLVVIQAITGLLVARPSALPLAVCLAYAVQAVSVWVVPRLRGASTRAPARLSRLQWLLTIGVDVVAFSALHLLDTNGSLNYTALLGLPVLMAGVLTPRPAAMATAAAVTLILLGDAGWSALSGGETTLLMTQAGLVGTGFFVIALLAGEMAGRLAREEMSARGSLELARQQAQLNRLVLEEMQDGVLVVDRRGRVRAANPAARLLLAAEGQCRPAPFQLQGIDAWIPLVNAVDRAFIDGHWPEAGRDVTLDFGPGAYRTLRVRVRFVRRRETETSEEFCVLLVEDLRHVHERLRQEKLAAMGRVSAGIAHEIRNPLAAIAQANALLAEDASDPAQRRLMQMVADNVERLKRIVDDVMEVAPGTSAESKVIDATAAIGALCSEWAATDGLKLGEHCMLRVDLPAQPVGVVFDPEHLRRVLVNLLDNARRHSSERPGAIQVSLVPRSATEVVLRVASDSPPIAAEVEAHLFEPFFSTRSRGTGLGLYICRELCERYGASIAYRQRGDDAGHRNEFIVVMNREALSSTEQRLQLAP